VELNSIDQDEVSRGGAEARRGMQHNGQIEHSGIQGDRGMAIRETSACLPGIVFVPSLRALRASA
jgi:hypothetical protein